MRAIVDKDICTGCGLCVDTCPDVFELDGEIAVVKSDPVPAKYEDSCREAADGCPLNAISIDE